MCPRLQLTYLFISHTIITLHERILVLNLVDGSTFHTYTDHLMLLLCSVIVHCLDEDTKHKISITFW